MVYSQSPEPDAFPIRVLDLPEYAVNNAFRHLDRVSLCKAAQACRLFLRLAGMHRLQRNPCLVDIYLPSGSSNVPRHVLQAIPISGRAAVSYQVSPICWSALWHLVFTCGKRIPDTGSGIRQRTS